MEDIFDFFTDAINYKNIYVGVSAGVDSMVLWYLVKERYKYNADRSIVIHCLHYDHQQRQDSAYDGLLIKKYVGNHYYHHGCYMGGKSNESQLRNKRYAFFLQKIRQHGSGVLLLGHHLDDRIETTLLNMLRGAHVQGIKNMEKKMLPNSYQAQYGMQSLMRPLINYSKNEICSFANKKNIVYREDSTNSDAAISKRNAVRGLLKSNIHPMSQGDSWRNSRRRLYQSLSVPMMQDLPELHRCEIPAPYRLLVSDIYKSARIYTMKELYYYLDSLGVHRDFRTGRQRELSLILQKKAQGKFHYISGGSFSHGLHIILATNSIYRIKAEYCRWKHYESNKEIALFSPGKYTIDKVTVFFTQEMINFYPKGAVLRFPRRGDKVGSISFWRRCSKKQVPLCFRPIIPIVCLKHQVITSFFDKYKCL